MAVIAVLGIVAVVMGVYLKDQVGTAEATPRYTAEEIVNDAQPPPGMISHASAYDGPQMLQVTEHIRVATGYAISNSIILDAPDGLIIVDTTESMEAAARIHAALRNITDKPIRALIYTHNHGDHIYGAKAYVEDESNPPEIWAHYKFEAELARFTATNLAMLPRAMRQFGILLPQQVAGLGNKVEYNYARTVGIMMPDHLVYNTADVNIAGMNLRLIPIPGETEDQIGIWLEEDRAFLVGDDIYRAFPNIYAIRGTPIRDITEWIASIDVIRQMRPSHLVPGHGRPVTGAEEIGRLLTLYRDGMQYVHDQTVRYMNQGMYPEDIALKVQLPVELRSEPYLAEMYGTVEWSVRSIFNQYIGWFSGNVADLPAMGTVEKAERMVALAGSKDKLLDASAEALESNDPKWALQLASHVFVLNPNDIRMLDIRLEALKALARTQTSTNGRHYYLTVALEDQKLVQNAVNQHVYVNFLNQMTFRELFTELQTRLAAERVVGVTDSVVMTFTDVGVSFTAAIRHSVLDVTEDVASESNLKLILSSDTFRNLLSGVLSEVDAYSNGDILIRKGDLAGLQTFLSYFDKIQ